MIKFCVKIIENQIIWNGRIKYLKVRDIGIRQ